MRRFAPLILFIVLLAGYGLMQSLSLFGFIDDAFISFRYARNLADGHGLVYNIGERVEGYSNTLFVLLLALLAKLGVKITLSATWLGIVFHAGTVALLLHLMQTLLTDKVLRPLPMLGLAFLMFHPSCVAYALAGMETPMAAFWLLAAVLFVVRSLRCENGVRCAVPAGVALFLLALSRPEGISMAAPLGLWLLLGKKEKRWPRSLIFGAVVTVLYGAFLLWRHSYFGYWQPNTYYAKAAGAGFGLVSMGLDYLWRFTNVTLIPYLLLPVLLLALRFRASLPGWWWGVFGTALAYVAALVYVGGDHFPLARFLIPIVPLLWLLLPEAARQTRQAINRVYPNIAELRLRPGAWVVAPIFLVLSIFVGMFFRNEGMIFIGQVKKAHVWCKIGHHLSQLYPADTTMGMIPIGAIGYCSQMPIVDFVGLTDATIAHTPTDLARSMAGHGRFNSEYVLEQKQPQIILSMIDVVPWPIPEWLLRYGAQHLALRDLIERRKFINDYSFHRIPMGETYFHYYSRRDFEDPETNPGTFPVDGVHSPIPEREPLAGSSLREKILGKRELPDADFEISDGWEVW